jgi:hypothetical protein
MSVQPVSPPPERRLAPDPPGAFRQLLLLGVAVLSLLAYDQVGRTYYRDFAVPQGVGMYSLLPEELAHYGMFMAFGLLVAWPLATLLGGSSLARTLSSRFYAVARRGWPGALTVALGATFACWAIAHFVLAHAATCDDEHTYRFIAQTLRTGSLVAPSPGTDLAFFREQFVVLTPAARYGKYPIGHPLLLAAAMALHAEALLVPAITGLIALAVYGVGLRLFGRGIAAAATVLFAVSPQVLLTGATLVSQPLAALCACGAVLCILGAEAGQPKLGWLCGAGACLGYGVMTRPLPGLLFAALALAYVVLDRSAAVGLRARLARAAALSLPLAVAAAAMLLVNVAQAADPLVTGYGAIQPSAEGPGVAALTLGAPGQRAMSLVGSAIRANFWLFGWPLSLGLCLFARGGRRVALLWGIVAAELCYRLISPKVGVGGTGPIYLYEAVPRSACSAPPACARSCVAAPFPSCAMRRARPPRCSRSESWRLPCSCRPSSRTCAAWPTRSSPCTG